MPKHVHKALSRKGKACAAWHEDTCPRNRSSSAMAMEYGDETSVALADALVAMIDEAGGAGTSSFLGFLLLLGGVSCIIFCTLREKREGERRKRFEAFMHEEGESLSSITRGSITPWSSRNLGPEPGRRHDVALGHARALADAMGMAPAGGAEVGEAATVACGDSDSRLDTGVRAAASTPEAKLVMAEEAKKDEAEAEALRLALRDAARRDIEERKERRRALAEETRQSAAKLERAAAEESARAELRTRAEAIKASGEVAVQNKPPSATPAVLEDDMAQPTAPLSPAASSNKKLVAAEAEFLAALDEI